MLEISYDDSSVESIFNFALQLTGKSLSDVSNIPQNAMSVRSRGRLGNLVETYYFGIRQNSDQKPDFPKVGLELKVTGVIPWKSKIQRHRSAIYTAKERLVLTMIDFDSIVDETWESSKFLQKSGFMLILFYGYESSEIDIHRKFLLPPLLFEIPSEDLQVIKQDWEIIRAKVEAGKAHEISEGDTFYLGACRKGAGGPNEKLRKQPYSDIPAKARAFCFKQSYISGIIQAHSISQPRAGNESIFMNGKVGSSRTSSLEELTYSKFAKFLNASVDEICLQLRIPQDIRASKAFHRHVADCILNRTGKPLSSLKRAGIELKTIRINPNGLPNEAMSFPRFTSAHIVEQDWEDSDFFECIERKFLFVIFKTDSSGVERLYKVSYWNMPFEDRLEAQRVWEETRRRLLDEVTEFPKSSESAVAHVRPKARNKDDTDSTPLGKLFTKQSFWLNKSYIAEVIRHL